LIERIFGNVNELQRRRKTVYDTGPQGFGEENGEAEVKQQAPEQIMIIVRPESLYFTLDLKFYCVDEVKTRVP
jgi:hypothetical protein